MPVLRRSDRNQMRRKDERGHIGLAWSVFAAYCFATALILNTALPGKRAWELTILQGSVRGRFPVTARWVSP